MPDFPPSGVPGFVWPLSLDVGEPKVLVTMFEDAREHRRLKNTSKVRRWVFEFRGTENQVEALLDHYDLVGLFTTFTAITWDPRAATPSTEEATVRYEFKPDAPTWIAVDNWRTRCLLVEVLT